ncbi:MAG: gamma-glutamyl-gamma-aminobutyrate hydrolase family protein [Acidimicrobiales bacterium]
MRPLIAVPGRPLRPGTVKGWQHDGFGVPRLYVDALHRAGGQEAGTLPVELDVAEARSRLQAFDGLLLLGGGDVDPACYGEDRRPEVGGVMADSDSFELSLAAAAVSDGVPTLAICRGIQVLNVALGGTLHQHITDPDGPVDHGGGGSDGERSPHVVRLEAGSRTAGVMGTTSPTCACHHHQALARLGEGLRAVGWAADGVIEAVEHDRAWLLAVQWHPEDTAAADAAHQRLFDALVARATGRSRARAPR